MASLEAGGDNRWEALPNPTMRSKNRFFSPFLKLSCLLLVFFGQLACAPSETERSELVPVEVELPKMDRQEPVTRERIERLHSRALSSLEQSPWDRAEIATAFGELGSHLAAIGLFESAADAFENARRAEPGTFRWHYYLGVSRQDDSKLEAAVDAYGDALKLKNDDVPTRLHRVDALLDLDRVDEAEETLEPVLTAGPGSDHEAAVQYARGRIAEARGQFQEVVQALERALEVQPDASAVRYPLSQAYLRLGEKELAAEHLALRGEQRPRFNDPLVAELGSLVSLTSLEVVRARVSRSDFDPVADLGYTLANLGGIQGAPERMAQIADGDSDLRATPMHEARFRYLLGGLWVDRGEDQKAEPQFRRALELSGDLTAARVMLGNLLARAERFDQALDAFSRAIDDDPSHVDARIKRAAVLGRLGRHQEALEDLDQAAETDPDSGDLTARRVALLDLTGNTSDADALLREKLGATQEPQTLAILHRVAGNRHKSAGRFEQALEAYSKALSANPGLVSAALEKAAILGHLNRFDEALRSFQDVLVQQPTSVEARRGEVTALILTGQYKDAVRSLEVALTHAVPSSSEELEWSHTLARLLAACPDASLRDGERALRLADRVFDARPTLVRGQTLAMAHAEKGDFAQAAVIQRNLMSEAERFGRATLVERLRQALRLYESGRPFRATHPSDLLVSTPSGEGAS